MTLEQGKQLAGKYLPQSGRRIASGLAVVVAVSLGYHVIFGANGLTRYQQKRTQHQQLQQQISELQLENARLQQKVDHLRSDPDAIEHEARVILRYAKPGEVIYALPNAPTSSK